MKHRIDLRQLRSQQLTKYFERKSKRDYLIISSHESQKEQIMPAALGIMLGLLNSANNYASTIDKSLPTCIEISLSIVTLSPYDCVNGPNK